MKSRKDKLQGYVFRLWYTRIKGQGGRLSTVLVALLVFSNSFKVGAFAGLGRPGEVLRPVLRVLRAGARLP